MVVSIARIRLASAAITGIAMACAQVHRLTDDEALSEIAAVIAKLPKADRQAALDLAASGYVEPGPGDYFFPSVAALLERAGANLDEARRLRAARGHGWAQQT